MVLSQMVVLEVYEDGLAAVLDKQGTVRMIPDKNYREGQVLHIDPESIRLPKKSTFESFTKKLMPIAACFAVAVGGILGGTAYAKPVSKLNVNSGAGMEYELNVFDRVISVNTKDEADKKIKEIAEEVKTEVKGKTVKEAVPITLTYLSDHDCLPAEGTNNIFTVDASEGKTQNLEAVVQESVTEWVNVNNEEGSVTDNKGTVAVEGAVTEGMTDSQAVQEEKPVTPAPALITDQSKPKDNKEPAETTEKTDNADQDQKIQEGSSDNKPEETSENNTKEEAVKDDAAEENTESAPAEENSESEAKDKSPVVSKQKKPHDNLDITGSANNGQLSDNENYETDLTDDAIMSDNINELPVSDEEPPTSSSDAEAE